MKSYKRLSAVYFVNCLVCAPGFFLRMQNRKDLLGVIAVYILIERIMQFNLREANCLF